MLTKQERILERRAMAASARVEEVLRRDHGVGYFHPSRDDEIRLLRLEQWEETYKVSLTWILKLLVPIWRGHLSKFRRRAAAPGSLGVRLATLVGNRSAEIVREAILRRFPDGENIVQWRLTQQERQYLAAGHEPNDENEDWTTIDDMLSSYRRNMKKSRSARRLFAHQMALRNYRDNPWRMPVRSKIRLERE